jgi:glycosyltransferase involved in cell wall biosynthesis
MKIVYWAPYVGHVGTIKAVINSAAAMRTYGGHEVTLIRNHTEWEGYEAELRRAGIQMADFGLKKRFPGLDKWERMGRRAYMVTVGLFGFFQLRRFLSETSTDVLITNLVAIPAILAARSIRHRPRIIVSVQGFPKFLGGDVGASRILWMRMEDWFRRALWNRVYNRADVIVCLTEATRRRLVEATRIQPERMVVVGNPIVDDQIHGKAAEDLRDTWFSSGGHKRVVAIGRLTRQKDFLTLLRSFVAVSRSVPVRLAILGEGEDRDLLEAEIARLDLTENVRLYGFVANPYSFLKRADLFVSTSLWEDPGHVVLEAAALRIPIVATACTGTAAVLGSHGGELCPVGAVEAISDAMTRVLRQGADLAKVEAAYERAKGFTPRQHYEALDPHLQGSPQ